VDNLKNLTVGSVAEYASQHVKIPLFIIPDGAKFENHKKIILALDHAPIKDSEALYQFHSIIKRSKPEVLLTQVVKEEKDFAIDFKITKYLKGLNFINNTIISSEEVNEALNNFADQSGIDYISLLHEDKNWLGQLLHNSVLKKELFNLKFPLLIIPK
jgi:hypothetical protein